MSHSDSSLPREQQNEPIRCDDSGAAIRTGHPSVSPPTCRICKSPLSVHERAVGTICSSPECKLAHVRATTQIENERQAEIWERVTKLDESQPDPSRNPRVLGVLPSNDRKLTVLPKRRKTVFVDRLMGIISQAAAVRLGNAELQDDGVGYEEPDDASENHLAILGNGCAVCRGHCCPQGSGHAFIHVDTILKYMESNPEKRPRDVLQDYLSRIGSRTYEDSCVYHCEQGCSLPREMRSKVCNGYLCKGLSEVLYKLEEHTVDRALVIAISDYYPSTQHGIPRPGDGEPQTTKGFVRAATIDPNGFQLYQCSDDDHRLRSASDDGSEGCLSADHDDDCTDSKTEK